MTLVPSAAKMASKESVNLVSRSRMRSSTGFVWAANLWVPKTRSLRTDSASGQRSSSATLVSVSHIPQKELRNHVGEVLRRAEAGETLTVTVAGRPVAELGPAHRRRWVSGATLAGIWRAKAPQGLDADLERLPAGVVDPFAS